MSENFETPLQSPKISRRDFLKLGAAGLGAVAAAPFIATKAEASGEKPFGYVGEKEYHVSGSTINFLGVLHTPGTLIKYKDLIDERVLKADIVISEVLPFEPTWTKDRSTLGRAILDGLHFGNDGHEFFEKFADIVKREQKPFAAIDPDNFYYALWSQLGEQGLLLYPPMHTGLEGLREKFKDTPVGRTLLWDKVPKMTRKSFLKWMGLFGLGLYLNYNNPYLVAPVRMKVQGPENFFDEMLTYGTDDKVIADSINYRNIIAGHSLRRLCKHFESEGGKKITIVYGIAHMEPIMEYAQNEHKMELALKTIPLAINNAFGDRSIRLYDYNLAANQWTRRSDIK